MPTEKVEVPSSEQPPAAMPDEKVELPGVPHAPALETTNTATETAPQTPRSPLSPDDGIPWARDFGPGETPLGAPAPPFATDVRSPASQPLSVASSTEPPPLNYSLKGRKRWIAFFWTLIVFDSVAIPLAVYFGLWYGVGPALCEKAPGAAHLPNKCAASDLSANAVFSISTACLGGVSIIEYFLRFYRLWKKNSTCRVIGARRAYLDWFHWNFSIAWVFIMVELIVGTVPEWPPIRLLAMPVSSLLFWFAFQLIVEDTLRLMDKRSPIRISSVPKGAHFRPGIYSIIEDVVAVDGSGGTEFRTRLNERFEQSHYFRRMLHRLTLFWAGGSLGAAVVTTVLVFTLERDAAYVVGWVLPFLWAGVWAWATIWYVKKSLAFERKEWGKPNALRNAFRYSIDAGRRLEAAAR